LNSTASGHSIAYQFDPELIPYIGLWINQGGWPRNSSAPAYTIALEPCSGAPDSLEKAFELGQAAQLAPNALAKWTLKIEVRDLPRFES
jgi:galactose mutarotase-like enzyme